MVQCLSDQDPAPKDLIQSGQVHPGFQPIHKSLSIIFTLDPSNIITVNLRVNRPWRRSATFSLLYFERG